MRGPFGGCDVAAVGPTWAALLHIHLLSRRHSLLPLLTPSYSYSYSHRPLLHIHLLLLSRHQLPPCSSLFNTFCFQFSLAASFLFLIRGMTCVNIFELVHVTAQQLIFVHIAWDSS